MPKSTSPYHGLLVVDKPGFPSQYLPTSHDIVAMVRRWSGQRRIGHTGTLDPMARGVLVLCLGSATRLVEYYQGHDKQYLAEIQLGTATDTYDAVGSVTERAPVPNLSDELVERTLAQFRGTISQEPPVYSAIKQQGEALYRKARRGEMVQVEPRTVTIHSLELISFTDDRLSVRVACSAGAYIRSLANDVGKALGTFGHLAVLQREAAGAFTLEDALALDDIRHASEAGTLSELLLPSGTGLEMPSVQLDTDTLTRLGYGQELNLPDDIVQGLMQDGLNPVNSPVQAITPDGALAGIIRCLEDVDPPSGQCLWRAIKWLAQP